jgi:6-phosphogluconolactonase
MYVYVGAYTGPGKSEGINTFLLDEASGALTPAGPVTPTDHPSFLALHPGRAVLYAVHETSPDEGAGPGVSAFRIDPTSGALALLNRQPSQGTSPCYVSLDPAGRFVLVANYGDGTLSIFPVQADGSLGEASHVEQHDGSGPHERRQQGPHAHSVQFDPGGRFVLACDLGIDRVMVYRLSDDGKLVANDPPGVATPAGGGPRHLAFSPDGRFAYVNDEISSALNVLAYDAERGALTLLQTVSTLPEGVSVPNNSTAQVKVHPSGLMVYVSNRGHDSLALFEVEAGKGTVTPVGHQPTGGRTPRNFNLTGDGTWLIAANQNGDSLVTFRADRTSGRLTETGQVVATAAPVCVCFAEM